MVDISQFAAPRSDQLNADDLIGGPRTITVTEVREAGGDAGPLAIYFDGCDGKPYKPGKSMMRALMFVWGPEGDDYVGRSMTLYRDPTVTFGRDEVGGIRISHMSHMSEAMEFPLTATRGKRKLYRVEPLQVKQRKTIDDHVRDYEAAIAGAADLSALMEIVGGEGASKLREALEKRGDTGKPFLDRMTTAERNRNAALNATDEPDGDDPDGLAGFADEPAGDDQFEEGGFDD